MEQLPPLTPEEEKILLEALSCESDEELQEYLNEACRGNEPLIKTIQEYLSLRLMAETIFGAVEHSPFSPGAASSDVKQPSVRNGWGRPW
ncbi:MAG: hypothetical protein KatS3mg111_3424 [Pirellulaceae bacterium]|nr:MAG: hypothetical protein KatS3mg111_3424 [Pirellulaceae bacterium]